MRLTSLLRSLARVRSSGNTTRLQRSGLTPRTKLVLSMIVLSNIETAFDFPEIAGLDAHCFFMVTGEDQDILIAHVEYRYGECLWIRSILVGVWGGECSRMRVLLLQKLFLCAAIFTWESSRRLHKKTCLLLTINSLGYSLANNVAYCRARLPTWSHSGL